MIGLAFPPLPGGHHLRFVAMFHDLTKGQKHALRAAAAMAHHRDRKMPREDRDVHYLEAENSDLPLVVGGAIVEGILAIEEIGEPARELVADLAARLQAIRDMRPSVVKATDEDEGYDASAPVSVAAIVSEFGLLRHESTLYVNRRTGDVRVVGHKRIFLDVNEDEDGELEADLDNTRMGGGREGRGA